jgi:hypothetical protein
MYRKEKEDTLGPGMKINNLFYLLKRWVSKFTGALTLHI